MRHASPRSTSPRLHSLLLVSGRARDAFLVTKLLNLYSRLSDLPSVVLTFRHTPVKTSITWNSMIACYAHHGFLKDALALGFTDEARKVFDEMKIKDLGC
ncbi:hypothetical protein ZIOFF_005605 [Zingiber officinale]|uniref:Pentatricopeptide repeat-containing protein n=1 Tax=Zingiber officinale TaxID=94328 RepID=A0A8J5IB09_ZINOF|nr:hypothetical protein ZIOFF_005605 [Zingiber officinale]